jgi:hypothetical protein
MPVGRRWPLTINRGSVDPCDPAGAGPPGKVATSSPAGPRLIPLPGDTLCPPKLPSLDRADGCGFGHNGPEPPSVQSGGLICMRWVAPSEKDEATATLEERLWDAADQFRANSGLKSQEYSSPVLGLIFLRFAEVRFAAQRAKLEKAEASSRRGSRVDDPAAYHAEGILYLPAEARFDYLLNRPEAEGIGGKVNAAMREIEKQNVQLAGVLPKTYNLFTSTLLKELLKKVSEIPASVDYDAFGRIYEYFLGEFARTEGQKGGEFYTPQVHRPAADRGDRAIPRPHPRSGVWFGRHVRAVSAVRGGAQEKSCR